MTTVESKKEDNFENITETLIEDDVVKKFCSQCYNYREFGLSLVQPYNQVYATGYMKHHERIQNFDCFEDDVWICTFPKSGTRWAQELVWCLRNSIEESKNGIFDITRVPFLEVSMLTSSQKTCMSLPSSYETVEALQRPRTIKTHLSYDMLPKQVHEKGAKMINLVRNPRDVCLSLLNHLRLTSSYSGDLETIADIFIRDLGPDSTPFFKHILSYWEQREQDPNLLIIFYEDMKQDVCGVIKRIAKFLNINVSEEEVNKLVEHTSVKNMKQNPMCNAEERMKMVRKLQNNKQTGTFIDKGTTGRWKANFSEETIERFEKWEAKWLEGTGLSFTYEL